MLVDEEQSFAFIHEICIFANTPRTDDAYVILGGDKQRDGRSTLVG